jgi:hypothetical protein
MKVMKRRWRGQERKKKKINVGENARIPVRGKRKLKNLDFRV